MEMNRLWLQNWKLTAFKTIRMTLVRPLLINFMKTVRAVLLLHGRPFPLSIKALAHWPSQGSGHLDKHLSSPCHKPQLQASKIKQTIHSANLASLLAFEKWATRPTFSYNMTSHPEHANLSGRLLAQMSSNHLFSSSPCQEVVRVVL